MHLHVRPVHLAWLILHFLGDVVVASAQVAWTTLQLGRQPLNAVIEVDLRTHSDFVLTVVAEMVSLVPGSLVVEARRSTHTLFLHVLDARDQEGVDKMRTQVFALERRVVLAFGAGIDHLDQPAGAAADSTPPGKDAP
jgi:multicomponent Na+:H+ antiporter subunit E